MKYSHILWDFNGTLLNDVEASIACVNIMLDKLQMPRTNLKQYHEQMTDSLRDYYAKVVDPKIFSYEMCTKNFQRHYFEHLDKAKLSDGALEMIKFFKKSGAKQYIVSSFEQSTLESVARKFGIYSYFEKISGDKDIYCGSKSGRAIEIVKDIPKQKVLYIGDTLADAQTADDVGCDCLLVACGHQSVKTLSGHGYPVLNSLKEVINHI